MLRASLAILVLCGVMLAALLGQQANSFQATPIHLTHHKWACPPAVSRIRCYRTIQSHDRWVLKANKKWHFAAWIVRHHRNELAHAQAHLKKIAARITERNLMTWCHQGECIKTLIRRLWPEDPYGAVTV